jgi:hypothetical protein
MGIPYAGRSERPGVGVGLIGPRPRAASRAQASGLRVSLLRAGQDFDWTAVHPAPKL